MAADEEHLRLLSIFHYVLGALGCLFACLPLIHAGLGLTMIYAPETFGAHGAPQFPAFAGWLFFGMGLAFFLVGECISVCVLVSGRCLAKRSRYTFSFVVGCVECMFVPLGTALGVFTIVVLSRDSVKALYGAAGDGAEEPT